MCGLCSVDRWHHNNDVIIKKNSTHVQNKISHEMYISDFLDLENEQNDTVL